MRLEQGQFEEQRGYVVRPVVHQAGGGLELESAAHAQRDEQEEAQVRKGCQLVFVLLINIVCVSTYQKKVTFSVVCKFVCQVQV